MKMNVQAKIFGAACALVLMAMGGARAQIVNALAVGNPTPVQDVLGRNLRGNWGESNSASRVEIREKGGGIEPPDPVTGEGSPANPLFRVSYLGNRVIGVNPGMFCEVLSNRLENGKSYFARVYDAPSASNAMYFANSAVFASPPDDVTTLDVVFQPVQRVNGEVDTDADEDGIPEWMELDLGTDPNDPDTDHDGYKDGFEVVHGDYLNPKLEDPREIWIRAPEIAGEPPVLTGQHFAGWWAVPDVSYRLEYRPKWRDGDSFSNIWSGTATETNLEVNVEAWVTNSPAKGFFRWIMP